MDASETGQIDMLLDIRVFRLRSGGDSYVI